MIGWDLQDKICVSSWPIDDDQIDPVSFLTLSYPGKWKIA